MTQNPCLSPSESQSQRSHTASGAVKWVRRSLVVLLAILLAIIWVMLSATPAMAKESNYLGYGNANITNQDFSNQDLTGGLFIAAEMRGTNFSGSNLSNAILTKGNMLGANLQHANLEGALVDRVTLYQADLTDAILVGATLTNSILDEAIITGADFTDAIVDRFTNSQLCKRADGVNSVTGVSTRESLGCR